MNKAEIIELMTAAGLTSFTDADIAAFLSSNNLAPDGTPKVSPIAPTQTISPSAVASMQQPFSATPQRVLDPQVLKGALKEKAAAFRPTAIAGANAIGQGVMAASLIGDNPNVAGAVGGGALQGIASGAQYGGVPGAVIGGAIGGTMGFVGAMNKQTAVDYARDREDKARRLGSTVSPTQFAYGGEIMDSAGNVGVQTEVGERIITPEGDIVMVKAQELHKDMKKDKITDFLPDGAVVFSAKDTKGMLIDPKKYKDEVIGYGVANYEENDLNPNELKEIKFGDILGDKPLTPSEALEKIRLKYPTVSNNEKDIFTVATNNENKKARVPFISILAMEQAKKNGALSPQQFGYGGGVRVRKYAFGTGIPNRKQIYTDDSGNLFDADGNIVDGDGNILQNKNAGIQENPIVLGENAAGYGFQDIVNDVVKPTFPRAERLAPSAVGSLNDKYAVGRLFR